MDLFLTEKADRQSLPLHSHTQTYPAELPFLPLLRTGVKLEATSRALEIIDLLFETK